MNTNNNDYSDLKLPSSQAKVAALRNEDGSVSIYRLAKQFPKGTHPNDVMRYIRSLVDRIEGLSPAITATTAREVDDEQFPIVHDLLVHDIEERREHGKRKYDVSLRPFDGNVLSIEAYQELLDALLYLRQMVYEETGR